MKNEQLNQEKSPIGILAAESENVKARNEPSDVSTAAGVSAGECKTNAASEGANVAPEAEEKCAEELSASKHEANEIATTSTGQDEESPLPASENPETSATTEDCVTDDCTCKESAQSDSSLAVKPRSVSLTEEELEQMRKEEFKRGFNAGVEQKMRNDSHTVLRDSVREQEQAGSQPIGRRSVWVDAFSAGR